VSGAASGQVALDDRVSGGVEAVRAAPTAAADEPAVVDPSTGAPISAAGHAVAEPNGAAANGHANGADGHALPSGGSSNGTGPKLVYHADPTDKDVAPEKVKGLAHATSTNGSYTSGAYVSKAVPLTAGESPEVRASFLSKLFFWWLNPIVWKGGKAALEDADMYDVTEQQEARKASEDFAAEWAIELARRDANPAYKPSVNKALYRIFRLEFWVGGMLKALIDGLQFLQPILLEWILTFIADSQFGNDRPPDWHGYLLAMAIGICPFLTTIMSNTYFRVMMKMGLKCRTILVTQLYRKSLRLAPAAKQSMSVGSIVNMMSTDASKVDMFMGYIHYLWSALEQVIISIALLFRAIGPSAAAGIGVVLLLIPIQGLVMKHLQNLRIATVKYTDRRVKLMNEILQGVRVIKVYAWEGSFLQKLYELRTQELHFVRKAAYTRAWNSTLMQVGPLLMSLVAYITLGLTSDNFEADKIFSSLSLFNLLRMPLLLFPMTLAFWSDARIGIQRIENFLLADELSSEPTYVESDSFALRVQGGTFAWDRVVAEKAINPKESLKDAMKAHEELTKETHRVNAEKVAKAMAAKAAAEAKAAGGNTEEKKQSEGEVEMAPLGASAAGAESDAAAEAQVFHLQDINFTIPKGSLTVIVGAVGSGKSSLLAGILGEMKRQAGSVEIAGSVGFCPQQAWIQNATLKDNVLFGLPFDQKKYDDVIRTCALTADIDVLPARDLTEIGEKGINLSGGQKQRVSLARSVYFDADVVLLDDPLSAVDAHVSKYLFNRCICDALRNKTRLLVTHQLQYVSSCDQVLFVEGGRITEQGTYTELMRNKGNFFTLMSTYVGQEDEDDESSESEEEPLSPVGEAAATAGDQQAVVPSGAGMLVPAAGDATKPKSTRKQRNRGLRTARSHSSANAGKDGAAVGHRKKSGAKLDADARKKAADEKKTAQSLMQAEERTKGGVPWEVYLYYMHHCGGWGLVALAIGVMAAQTAASTWVTWWLGLWSDDEYNKSMNFYLGIYAALGGGQALLTLIGTVLSAYMGIVAAVTLHNKSFSSVMHAPMSFFDTTPIGRIINRFSKDQDVIDSLLMDTLRMIIFMAMSVLSTFIMIAYVTPIILAPLFPIFLVYYAVQYLYRQTSRELKRIESISRSPLFSHFSETLTGLATIRAYRAQDSFIRANEARMNGNNRSYYLLVLTQRWLSIRVETIGALISFFAALFVVVQRDSLNAGSAGVSLSYALSITSVLNWVVRQTVEAENSMNSVERTKYYSDSIEQERPEHIPAVDEPVEKAHWPQRGAIEIKDLQIRYRQGLPLVLHGISLSIKGGERIGIVGRTGAGKSSLMVALFRIVEAASGSISIDGVDISTLGLDALRSKLAIIPQDPVLFSGTIRSNLDPFNQYSDEQLWTVLEKAHLKDAFAALDNGLQEPVADNGENFSVGQRCQLCLARAMLRNARVMVMDEATASVDMATDAFIQTSLREHFDCTLLTIAHRLNTICDYDRVLVLSFGLVEEFDTPANLLRNPNSHLTSMVNETGPVNAALLRDIAFKKEAGLRVDIGKALGAEGEVGTTGIAAGTGNGTQGQGQLREPSRSQASQVRWHDPEHDPEAEE